MTVILGLLYIEKNVGKGGARGKKPTTKNRSGLCGKRVKII